MQPKHASDDLVAIGEASASLGVHADTLRRWEKAGRIEALRTPTGHRRYRRSDIAQLLASSSRRSES